MANENRLERWLSMQRVTWQHDEASKATKVVMLDRDNEQIAEFALTTPNLATVISDVLDMQAEELPNGAHSFRLIAQDDQKKQLSELRQTIRGRNKDATSAAHEAITRENAAAKGLSNSAEVQRQLYQLNERLAESLDSERDNVTQLLDALRVSQNENFDSKLRWEEFVKRQDRIDKTLEVVGDLVKMFAPMMIQKFLPGFAMPALEPQKEPPSGPAEKPSDAPSSSVPEPGQAVLSPGAEGGSEGDSGGVPAKPRRSASAKSTAAAKRRPTKGR